MTETREPFVPELTEKTVPVTATLQSGALTYRLPRLTVGGLHDDAALVEMDGRVAAVGADAQLGALIHFHFGAVERASQQHEQSAAVRMNSPWEISSPTFNARSPAQPML